MNFFEGLGMFVVAAVVFLILSFLIGAIFTFTYDNADEWLYLAAWLVGSFIYGITVVVMVYISRYGGSL